MYWYASRAYDPVIGRFTAPDNIVPEPGNPQALNRYSYVANNPLRFVDPSGHAWEDDFRDAHGGQDPTEQDRFDYELSLLTGHAWTDHDWQKTYESRQSLWSLTKLDDGGQAGQSQPASSGPVIGGPVIFVPTPVFDIVWKFAKGKDRERQRLRLNTMRVQLQYSESGSTPFTDSVVLVGAEPGDPVTSAQVKEGLDILYGKNYIPNSLRGEASAALQVAKDAVDNIVRGGGAWQSRHYVTAPFGARGRSSWRWDVVNDYGHNLRS